MPQLQDRVKELLSEYGIPSAVIGVLREGEITELAVGVKDVATREAATPDTIYQIGSLTKTWTALAFLQFVDEGKVDLDAPVRDCLPGFAVGDAVTGAGVTPRHLLNHTNGIEEAYGDPGEADEVYQRMVAAIADAPQVFPLGHTHGYSATLGYGILARIMEVADGKPWDAVLRARLLDGMGLDHTSSRPGLADRSRTATGHLIRSRAEGPVITPISHLPRAFDPGGGITSTARDVLAMAHVLLNEGVTADGRRIVSAGALREMLHSRVPVPDPYTFGPEWALGLIVGDWGGQTVHVSDGSTIGQHSRLRILPDANTAVTMLANGGPRDGFYRAVFNEVLDALGLDAVPEMPAPDEAVRLDFGAYEGVYERPDARLEVSAEAGRLSLTQVVDSRRAAVLRRPERVTYELLPLSRTHFVMPPRDDLEDPQSVAIYDFGDDGRAGYLHTNCRVYPRVEMDAHA